jgi:hypothetical protein
MRLPVADVADRDDGVETRLDAGRAHDVLELVAELSGGDRDPVGHRRKLAVVVLDGERRAHRCGPLDVERGDETIVLCDVPLQLSTIARMPPSPTDARSLRVPVDGHAVLPEGHQRHRRIELRHEAGRVVGATARELVLLDQQHVAPAGAREVIGDAAAGDAAADDDDPCGLNRGCAGAYIGERARAGRRAWFEGRSPALKEPADRADGLGTIPLHGA